RGRRGHFQRRRRWWVGLQSGWPSAPDALAGLLPQGRPNAPQRSEPVDYGHKARAFGWMEIFRVAPAMPHLRRTHMANNRISDLMMDDATLLRRSAEVEREREVALRDLAHESSFTPLRATARGHEGPWSLRLAVDDGRLAITVGDSNGD